MPTVARDVPFRFFFYSNEGSEDPPLAWYPRLLHATAAELSNWKILGNGEGIQWPDLDEDLSVAGLLLGRRAAHERR